MAPDMERQRLSRLDGLRGLAACAVAFPYHGKFLFDGASFAGSDVAVIAWLHRFGWTFVDLFFVLSGYVFAHVYLGGQGLKTPRDLADFTVARFSRLYPLHLVMLVATALFVFGRPGNGALEFLANLTMLQALARPFSESFDGPSWSLSVESFCYVLFALGAASGRRSLLWLTGGLVAINALRFAVIGHPGGPYVAEVFSRGMLGFFIGQLLWHGRIRVAAIPAPILVPLLLAAIAGGICATALPVSPILPLTCLAWPAALLLALKMPMLGSRAAIWLGDRSYAIYLVNMPLVQAAAGLFGPLPGTVPMAIGGHVLLVLMTLALSDIALRRIEMPARRAIRGVWHRAHKPAIARTASA